MQAVVIDEFGEPKDVLGTREVPAPEPGPGELRIATVLSPIHNHDLAIIRGVYGYRPPLPATPGTEAVGVVDAVGAGVTGLEVGQRVAVAGTRAAWADFFVARADQVVPVPPNVPDETACQLLAMPLSSLMLLDDLRVQPGQWIAVNAANGAVGRQVNLFAQQRGVRVLSLVRGPDSVRALEQLGFGPVLDTEVDGWATRAAEVTNGEPIVRGVDQVSGPAANALMSLLAPRGELVSFGALSGQPLIIDTGAVIFKQAVVKGFWGQQRGAEIDRGDYVRLITELVGWAADGTVRLDVQAEFPLDRAGEAAVVSETPGRNGKVVLRAGAR
ncbi:alcohol dehydrogenase catalytic domain-containing protein [Nocardia neocaledoniensis]|uniref:alcohol dehydrogenase catalytic domain-containing protein n=1 Tax=Nocardia neocaledoniensis TaxID=236511 RepID=UPI002456D482|nr:zinc-binding dehydrogenase [Nocardia neocaledoniensis]